MKLRAGYIPAARAAAIIAMLGIAANSSAQTKMLTFPAQQPSAIGAPDGGPLSTPPLTVEAWFYLGPPTDPYQYGSGAILGKGDTTFAYIISAGGTVGGQVWATLNTPGAPMGTTHIGSAALQPLAWHHVALAYDATTANLYIDGILESTVALPTSVPPNGFEPLFIGPIAGKIDEVRVWSTVRNQAEIQATMHRRLDNQPHLVAAWHFDGNYLDLTGGHHGFVTQGAGVILADSTAPVGPLLAAPATAPIWSTIAYDLTDCAPGSPYLLEISTAGTVPGIPIPSPYPPGNFPLNPPFLYSTYGSLLPGFFQGFIGTMDGSGAAQAGLVIPPEPALVGIPISAAFASFDPAAPNQFGGVSLGHTTTITTYPALALANVAPDIADPGEIVVVTGEGFRQTSTLDVSGTPVVPLSITPTEITFAAPPGTPCDAELTVSNGASESATLPFNPSPVITSTTNASGQAAGGQTMFIIGNHFDQGTTVTVSGVPALLAFSFPTVLGVLVPPGTPGPADVVVTSPNGCTTQTTFTYY